MSLDLEQMRKWLRKGAGNLTSSELDDTDADELLNMSLWELDDRFDFLAQGYRFRFTTVVDQSTYSMSNLTTPNSIMSVAIITDEGQRIKLSRMTDDWFHENVTLSSATNGQPARYLRDGDCLRLDKNPDDTYTIEIQMRVGVASLEEGVQETSQFPRNWDELVVQGAIARAHLYNEDYQLAQQVTNFQVGGVRQAQENKVRIQKDSRYAGLGVIWDNPHD